MLVRGDSIKVIVKFTVRKLRPTLAGWHSTTRAALRTTFNVEGQGHIKLASSVHKRLVSASS